ncbi:MAG: pyk [Myxococcaceae bacterium]|nr:pyk [Myxococcaceae bacterium]
MEPLSLDLTRIALKQRRTKIVATIGPASNSPEMLARLIAAGVDVFRLNFSHGTQDAHGAAFTHIRTAAELAGKHVAVLADLCGPKIRVGTFEGGAIELVSGATVTVTTRAVIGGLGLIPSEYQALVTDVKPSDRILLDDGKLELKVVSTRGQDISCTVITGGRLSNKKGMNLPNVAVSAEALTEKDRADALFAAKLGVDYLALSFVRSGDDLRGLKALLAANGFSTPVIAKIEKPEALKVIGDILEATDGVMVARGDLGVEMAAEEVPLIQQELIRLSRKTHRPVIVATQMLESMIECPRPTRAEVTDVAAAAFAYADAVMLSAETAAGKYPVEAVATMDRVLRLVEGYQWKGRAHGRITDNDSNEEVRISSAVSRATTLLSRDLQVRAVVVPTRSGGTARVVSSERPAAPVVAISSDPAVCRRLGLQWGITPVCATDAQLARPDVFARELVKKIGLASTGERILMVWDSDPTHRGLEPTVSVLTVD